MQEPDSEGKDSQSWPRVANISQQQLPRTNGCRIARICAPAAGRGSDRVVLLSGRGRGRGQRSEASIALPRKVCTTSCYCASNYWIEEPGKAPHPVRIPTSAEELLSGGPLAVDINSRQKRIRNSSCSSGASLPEILGVDKSKEDTSFPPPSRNFSMDLPTPQFASSEPPQVFPALEALRQYSILVDGARVDGPDLLLQDIPWGHLPLICALGRPLDFIPTSHILKVRRVFTHCLQAVLASPLE